MCAFHAQEQIIVLNVIPLRNVSQLVKLFDGAVTPRGVVLPRVETNGDFLINGEMVGEILFHHEKQVLQLQLE